MTDLQFERWEDFALRMARTCFKRNRRPNERWIAEVIEDFFYPMTESCWRNILSWDKNVEGFGCTGDQVTEFLDYYDPPSPRCKACREYDRDAACRCEEIEELAYEQWQDQWGGPVRCCLRAGLDMACEPSAGVLGFTAGDIRRMYPEGVPDWVFPANEQLRHWPGDEINGTFAELPDGAGLVL